jgi:phosphoribosylformimino-5-aminoimidazole carboxamide ribonucleotide (ProFAR) isomerase
MASETIKAKDLTTGTAVKFYDGQWHRATVITKLKKKDATEFPRGTFKTLHVADSRGWGNHFAPDQDIEIDRTL